MSVLRSVTGHRSTDGVYCDRCGLPVVKWEEARCVPSNVEVLVRRDEPEDLTLVGIDGCYCVPRSEP